jgi:5-formaminoimidazole-4-carboxamide-1-(beta)-D-ribofuranosyl 5'-monophosphate synthetase
MRYTIATLASHSCLQILKGAKDEGFATLAIATKERVSFYQRFKFIDEIIGLKDYKELFAIQDKLKKKNTIIIPHGSFVAYLGEDYDQKLKLSHYGNKKVLGWEGNRLKQMSWLKEANLFLPKVYDDCSHIDQLVIVKLFGARGGSGYFLAKDKNDFERKIKKFKDEKYIIQQYLVGTPVYLQYFYSNLGNKIELMGVDRRYETNVDGLSRIPSPYAERVDIDPTYTVIGNFPLVVRESLLPQVYEMGEKVVKASQKLIPPKGLYGPFCLETIITKNQRFYCIEISCRIVAGTNLFIKGSSYTDLVYGEPMSTGRRIAREIKEAIKEDRLSEILD